MGFTVSDLEAPQWRALIAAEQKASRLRAEFNRSEDRTAILSDALAMTSPLDRSTAITFLRLIPEDVPKVLEQLVGLCLSADWLTLAREPIRSARSESLLVKLDEIVSRVLEGNTFAQDYHNMASMLAYVEAWEILARVLEKARGSSDAEIRDVADEYTCTYGGMLPPIDQIRSATPRDPA
jgi:hypothetical protein